MSVAARALLALSVAALAACAASLEGSPILPDNAAGPRAELYVFNVSRGTLVPERKYVTIDGYPLASLWRETWRLVRVKPGPHEVALDGRELPLEITAGGVYYVAVGYRPQREWLLPAGPHPIYLRRISEADALRLFTEMKPRQ